MGQKLEGRFRMNCAVEPHQLDIEVLGSILAHETKAPQGLVRQERWRPAMLLAKSTCPFLSEWISGSLLEIPRLSLSLTDGCRFCSTFP